MQRSRPDDYEPPYPTYGIGEVSGDVKKAQPEYICSLVGVQSLEPGAGEALTQRILGLLTADDVGKPKHVERARESRDNAGYANDVLMPYWMSAEEMTQFWARPDVQALLDEPLEGPVGWWRESFHAPLTGLDSSSTQPDMRWGLGRYLEQKLERFHSYFGSMRDRVSDFLSGAADGEAGQIAAGQTVESFGNRLRVSDLPDKICFIRGPFGWRKATPEQVVAFEADMLPIFEAGTNYLRDNPIDANCMSSRFLWEVDRGLDTEVDVNVVAWFLTLKDLEEWTHHHPTHLAIFGGFHKFMRRFEGQVRLTAGHEVIVVPQGQAVMEYVNCHPKTGMLPYFPAQRVEPQGRKAAA
ncbi:MAG: phenylacetaldoxime dehydratase family protein [Pseudomonadota bacterium]